MSQEKYQTINITTDKKELDFAHAKKISEEHASGIIKGPMLVAWYDAKKREEHPCIPECQHKPGWLAYADGHGGCLRVNINEDEYSFIFSESGIIDD
ncbi:MAG: AF1514 family protein [Gammaproteobacteria bacterium]